MNLTPLNLLILSILCLSMSLPATADDDIDEAMIPFHESNHESDGETERSPASEPEKVPMLPPESAIKSKTSSEVEIPVYVDEAKESAQAKKEKELLKKFYEMEKKKLRAKKKSLKSHSL